jgi:hypothetical protein
MLVFDVRCEILDPISLSDAKGNDVTIAPGHYRLQGVEHLVRRAASPAAAAGTDITFVTETDGRAAYVVSAENLAHFIASDEVEVKI